jgi:plasmid stabilization system protein ParE
MRDLDEIWDRNADQYDADHAENYLSLLRNESYKLDHAYAEARPVPTANEFFYVTIRKSRRSQGHGHVAIFQIVGQTVELLRFFHTRQDWQGKAERGEL